MSENIIKISYIGKSDEKTSNISPFGDFIQCYVNKPYQKITKKLEINFNLDIWYNIKHVRNI